MDGEEDTDDFLDNAGPSFMHGGSVDACTCGSDPSCLCSLKANTEGNFLQDCFGYFLVPLKGRPVRFTDFHPVHHTDGFFYDILLQHVPFRSDSHLLSPKNATKTYFEECQLRGVITCDEDLEDCVSRYSMRNLHSHDQRMQLAELVLSKQRVDTSLFSQATIAVETDADRPNLDADTLFDILYSGDGSIELKHIDFPPVNPEDLTTEQGAIVNDLLLGLAKGLHVILGPPDTGKTYLTKHLAKRFIDAGKRVVVCASTGAAAVRLHPSATSVHRKFGIPPKAKYLTPLFSGSYLHIDLFSAEVIFIDEFSMLTRELLDSALYRLQQVNGPDVLKNKLVVLVGDHMQLPAVCFHTHDTDHVCMDCHITRSVAWSTTIIHHLLGSVQHASDPEFLQFLYYVRTKVPTQKMINDVFEACFISQADAELLVNKDTTVLCTHRDAVHHYNNLMAHRLFADPGQLHIIPLHTNAGSVQELKEWTQGTNFHQLPCVAVNAKVILTNNLKTSLFRKGAANGAMGTVVDVSTKQNGYVSFVSVQLQRHVLDAICHMRINLRELARSVRERLRDAESARGSCERAARVREACEKPTSSLREFARNLQGLRSWFKLQEVFQWSWHYHCRQVGL
jgi:hypothetical protein